LTGFSLLVWRGLFFVPAMALLVLAVVVLVFLKDRPPTAKEPEETATGPNNINEQPSVSEPSLPTAWWRLFRSPAFLLILWASAAFTLLRTFFDDFTALWLSGSLPVSTAGYISALFTVGGIAGTVMIGFISDRVGKGNRGPYIIASGLGLGVLLFASPLFPKDSVWWSAVFFSLTGFFIFGAYSVVAGVSAIDFGGQTAPATAAGLIDGVGYLAAALAGIMVAHLKDLADWEALVKIFAAATIVISISLLPLWKKYPTKEVV
jgi:sugar phosphate permease